MKISFLWAAVLVASLNSVAIAQTVLYRETFGRPDLAGNQNLPNWDWQRFQVTGAVAGGGGVSGDGDGGKPIDLANTESAGPNADGTFNVYAEGWQYMDSQHRLSMTTEYAFDAAAVAPVTFRWWQGAAQIAGVDQQAKIAVRVSGAWYVSAQGFTNPPVTAGANFGSTDPLIQGAVERSMAFDPAAANWLTLNFDGDYDAVNNTSTASTVAPSIGPPAAAPLSGQITAFGIYRDAHGANMRFDNFTIEGRGLHPGDVDKDEDVDIFDFNAIRDHFQQSATMREQGDLTGDGIVDFKDFRQWKDNFPFTPPPATAAAGAVPEPAGVCLGLMAAAVLVGAKRSMHRRRTA